MLSLEEIEKELHDEFAVAGLDIDGPPYANEGWPLARELAYRCAVRISEKQNAGDTGIPWASTQETA